MTPYITSANSAYAVLLRTSRIAIVTLHTHDH